MARPTKYSEELQAKLDKYIVDTDCPYIEEVAEELDIDDDTIRDWCKAEGSRYKAQFSASIKRLMRKQKLMLMKKSSNKDYAVAGLIFQLKANHGLSELQRVDHTSNGEKLAVNINFSDNPAGQDDE